MAIRTVSESGASNDVTCGGTSHVASDISVSALTRAASSFTCTATSTAHGFAVGDRVTISGAAEPDFNGTFVILTAADADTFTYAAPFKGSLTATGTIAVRREGDARGCYVEERRDGFFFRYYMQSNTGGHQTMRLVDKVPDTRAAITPRWGGLRA